ATLFMVGQPKLNRSLAGNFSQKRQRNRESRLKCRFAIIPSCIFPAPALIRPINELRRQKMAETNVADVLVEYLSSRGVQKIFGVLAHTSFAIGDAIAKR